MKKIRIMFVCHGNICRSPMAEFIMKKLVGERGLSDRFLINSSATSTEEIWRGIGSPIHREAKRELSRHGVLYSERRATLLEKGDYSEYDLFVGMDSRNVENMHRIFTADPDGKIKLLMEFTDCGGEVSDPYYTGNFGKAYIDIHNGCEALLDTLTKNINKCNV